MARHPLGDIKVATFLADYWQKKPCLIRNAFPDFEAPLSGDDLAGLSMDPLAESRIVKGTFPQHDWSVAYGPFDESTYSEIGDRNWTLLIQDVEKHYPPLNELMNSFDFIPQWRWDDLMISFAATGGSVGPHVDQYDVFLLQASGARRWEIASHFNPEELADCELKVLKQFEPENSMTLEPGDLLYLPPGVAHHGVALEPGLTYSVGFRAPDSAVLFQALGEYLEVNEADNVRYKDPVLTPPHQSGEISQQAITAFQSLLTNSINSSGFEEFLGSFLSKYRTAHVPGAPDQEIKLADLKRKLEGDAQLQKNPWSRMTWVNAGHEAKLHSSGIALLCSVKLATRCCANELDQLDAATLSPADWQALSQLLNQGHIYFSTD